MLKLHALRALLLSFALAGCATTPSQTTLAQAIALQAASVAPVAAQKPHEVDSPNGKRSDPYYWLRDDKRENPEMLAYLKAENAYADAQMAPLKTLQSRLVTELRSRLREDDSTAPTYSNGWWYYTRYETGKEYPIHARKLGTLEAAEQVLLDGNAMAEGKGFFQIGGLEVSPDNQWLAYAEDTVGRRQFVLHIKNLVTGETLADAITPIQGDLAWLNDNKTVLYTETNPETLLGYRVRAHSVGQPMAADAIVYTEKDNTYYIGTGRSKSGQQVFIMAHSTLQSEQFYADAKGLPLKFKPILPREAGHEYFAEHLPGAKGRGEFIIRSNWKAPNFRVMSVPVGKSANKRNWKTLVAHRDKAFIEEMDVFSNYLVLNERSGGLLKLRIKPLQRGGKESLIAFDEPAYTAQLVATPELGSKTLRYVYTSLTTPETTVDYDLATGARTERKVQAVLGGFDSKSYVTEYLWAPARDGTLVPVSLVYRKSTRLDGTAPLYQYAYGSYGYSSDPTFRSERLALLDRGFVYAIAHVRGGQELGHDWYENGKLLKKINTFSDFIDVTGFLVGKGYVAKDKVFAEGRSAGGLLMGAINNMAPETYRGIIAGVPFVDVVTTMLDESIPLTTGEFDEWGNPKQKPYYDYMLGYSPYDNVSARAYPALYVHTGLWDSQVQYYEPSKWVAKLRTADTTPATPIIYRVNMEAGHGGKSGRFQRLQDTAEQYSFVLGQLGLVE
ncbi:MAG: S9 family peptidase [Stagnimonas sp.]|nr:S9 family peptidase [Stagnimonas sp.]